MKSPAHCGSPMPAATCTESLLKMGRYLGMLGLLGGLAALSAMWAFGPAPDSIEGWRLLIGLMRPVFYACFFAGVVVLVIVGSISWWRHRRELHGSRWFRVMMIALVLAIPTLHFSARVTALALYDAIDSGDVDRVGELWNRLGLLYLAGFIALLLISAVGVFKPRLGARETR